MLPLLLGCQAWDHQLILGFLGAQACGKAAPANSPPCACARPAADGTCCLLGATHMGGSAAPLLSLPLLSLLLLSLPLLSLPLLSLLLPPRLGR